MSSRHIFEGAGLLTLVLMIASAHAKPNVAQPAMPAEVTKRAVSQATGALKSLQSAPLTSSEGESRKAFSQALEEVARAHIQHSDQLDRTHQALQKQIEGLRPSWWDKWLTVLTGLVGALMGTTVAAYSAYRLQQQRHQFEQISARQTAGINELAQIKLFRSRQLNEFYGPLQALLQQGLVVRNELYRRMRASPATGVNFSDLPPRPGSQHQSLGIQHGSGEIRPFRLIDELPFIRKAYPHLMGNVGEMVRINGLVVALIHERVGLVLHDNEDLSQKLGVFLAHQSVLQDVYKSVKGNSDGAGPAFGYSTTFPDGLQEAVDGDCAKLRDELREWEGRVTQWSQSRSNS